MRAYCCAVGLGWLGERVRRRMFPETASCAFTGLDSFAGCSFRLAGGAHERSGYVYGCVMRKRFGISKYGWWWYEWWDTFVDEPRKQRKRSKQGIER